MKASQSNLTILEVARWVRHRPLGHHARWAVVVLVGIGLVIGTTGPLAAQSENWPRSINLPEADITVYQPQPEQFEGNELRARAVVSVKPAKVKNPVFGVVWITARVGIDRAERTVQIQGATVTDVRFPGDQKQANIDRLKQLLEAEVPKWDLTLSLDDLMVSLEGVEGVQIESESVRNAPPQIIFVNRPTVLVTLDGEPILRPIEGTGISSVANTPFSIAWDQAQSRFYLVLGSFWYWATAIRGPWEPTEVVPSDVLKSLSSDPQETEESDDEDAQPAARPEIIVATEPTELIATNGEPSYVPIESGAVLYLDNTENDLLLEVATNLHFVLLSGRWYRAEALEGPWTFVEPSELPQSFQEIRESSIVGHLRSHVPGTAEAREAVLDAFVPETAAVQRSASTEVVYDGEPKFERIPGTNLEYALNSPSSVLKSNQRYYVCEEAIWYESDNATGPWTVAVERPAQVESIPPDSPVQHVKYVYIYQSTPQVVYVGYTPGYIGTHVYYGTVVYGTGYVYSPWVGPVYYYPRPVTWGVRVRYDPWYGWSFGVGVHHGGFGTSFVYWSGPSYRPPYYGGWWGPGGYRPPHYRPPYYRPPGYRPPGYRPRPMPVNAANRANVYQRPESAARPTTRRPPAPGQMPSLRPARVPNNVLSDSDGNIYRRTKEDWERRDGDRWRGVSSQRPAASAPPAGTPNQRPAGQVGLNRDSLDQQQQMRQRGAERKQQFQQRQSSGRPRVAQPRRR